jgi:hypothetical protein
VSVDQIVGRSTPWRANGGGFGPKRLRGHEVFSPGTADCGHGALFDRPHRLCRFARSNTYVDPCLLTLRDGFDAPTVDVDVHERRRGGKRS